MNSAGNPASAGSMVVISATGEGQTDPAGVDGKLADSPAPVPLQPVTVTIGGLDAQVLSAGGASRLGAGHFRVAAHIPAGVSSRATPPLAVLLSVTTRP